MAEIITIKHNHVFVEAWHDKCLVATSENALLSGIVSPVMSYASSFDQLTIIYKRPSGPGGKISDTTLYQRNTRMNFSAGAPEWTDWRPTSFQAPA